MEAYRRKVLEEAVDMLQVCPSGTLSRWLDIKNFLLADHIVECPTCKSLKASSPTPEGDDTCWSCGDREMLDYESPNL